MGGFRGRDQGLEPALSCAAAFALLPVSVFIGLVVQGAVSASPAYELGAHFAWMAMFVVSIFLPAHLVMQALTFLLARNRLVCRHQLNVVLLLSLVPALTIATSAIVNPFTTVFSIANVVAFVTTYAVAAGKRRPLAATAGRG